MARKYLNNYVTLLSTAITDADTTMTVGTPPPALDPGDFCRLQLSQRNAQGVLLKQEFVDVTAVSGNDLTITRAAEGSTALSWDAGARVELVETAESFDPSGNYDPSGSAANAQAYAIQRENHTGTQPLSTISDAGTAASSDIVGTVSQSGGVPTGAIIQRGSNANGEFVRFADGTQICTTKILFGSIGANGSGTYTDPYYSVSESWAFPSSFAEIPEISFQNLNDPEESVVPRVIVAFPYTVSTAQAGSVRAYSLAGSPAASATISAIAIGRWY